MRAGQGWASRVLAMVALSVVWVLLGALPAGAADTFVQVVPSTVQAGHRVEIRASCQDDSAAATVESPAFGTVTLHSKDGVLIGDALVPESTRAGTYRVKLNCPNGVDASTTLIVVAAGQPSRGPAAGFGGGSESDPGRWLLPGGIAAILAGLVLGLAARRAGGVTGRR